MLPYELLETPWDVYAYLVTSKIFIVNIDVKIIFIRGMVTCIAGILQILKCKTAVQ